MQTGQLKVPPGYHPLDVEKEWGRLHVAILEREKLLRSEFERQVRASGTASQGKAGGAASGAGHFLLLSREPHRQEGRRLPPSCSQPGPTRP